MPSLFPNVTLPTIAIPTASNEKKSLISPKWDWLTGDFVLTDSGDMTFADARDSFADWCMKICMTERGSRLAYSDDIGVELEAAMKLPSPEAAKSAIMRTLTEAILAHPKAEAVKNFSFGGTGDNLRVTFTVKARDFDDEIPLGVVI